MKVINIILGCIFLILSAGVYMGMEVSPLSLATAYLTIAILFFGEVLESDKK